LNSAILNTDVQDFILENIDKPIHEIVLKGSPFKDVSVQELATQISVKKKCKNKLETWFNTPNIYYPNKMNIEQSSSEKTALFKSNLVNGKNMIDLTGGFGVDDYFFSKQFDHVDHCEINETLSTIASHNYKALKCENIKVHSGDGITVLRNQTTKYDLIYVDPSRRNNEKGKVFLLEDCLPVIPKHLDFLLEKSDRILLKVSPLLDIIGALRELKFVSEIHVVAVQNEVKELLFLIKKDWTKKVRISAINISRSSTQKFSFQLNDPAQASFSKPLRYLYEPNAALLKAGAYNHLSAHFKLSKLHKNSHLFTAESLIDFPGRSFEIEHIMNYNKKEIKKLIPGNKANITTRNFKETVLQIRKKTGILDGGELFLFFTTDLNEKQIVLLCKKV